MIKLTVLFNLQAGFETWNWLLNYLKVEHKTCFLLLGLMVACGLSAGMADGKTE